MATSAIRSEKGQNKKKEQIDTIINLAEQNSVIGLVNLSGISSKALQDIRSSMRSGEVVATLKVAKNTLKTLALEKIDKPGIAKLIPYINGSCALIFTKANPFRLQKFLNQNQVPAPAKTGQISPVDVFVSEGVTNLDPGPIIGELGSIGLQTRIEKGKIRITKTAKVLSIGDTVSEAHATVLSRLGIQPFKVGLKLNTVLENEEIIDGSILDVDENKMIADLQRAYLDALFLAINPKLAYYSTASTPFLLKTAISQAMALSVKCNYVTDRTIDFFVAKTLKQAELLKEQVLRKDPEFKFE
ncbi:MAG: 50S ribosomal protein L10 [Candidatus Heimdallarchaeota archaeon]|nr:MAG: 50S ribosomal protein L10 [Candidatus Heimdallarchaeota archaeon]